MVNWIEGGLNTFRGGSFFVDILRELINFGFFLGKRRSVQL